jgi:hypothetical protein
MLTQKQIEEMDKLTGLGSSNSQSRIAELDALASNTPTTQSRSGFSLGEIAPGGKLAQGLGQAIAQPKIAKELEETQAQQIGIQTQLLERIKQNKEQGKDTSRLENALAMITEEIGATGEGAKELLNPNQLTNKKVLGSAAELATIALPMGAISKGATTGLKAVGAGAKLAKVGGNVLSGGSIGLASDAATQLASGKESVSPGLGTAIGAGIPFVAPIAGKTGRIGSKMMSEIQGALTGTSGETIELAFDATRKGGKSSKQFYTALRKNLTPEQLAENAKDAVQQVATTQQARYAEGLQAISDEIVDTTKVLKGFEDQISKAGIVVKNGVLDFSGSKLRTVPKSQTKLQEAYTELQRLKPNSTLGEIDTSRQALKALRLAGDDPSANLANKFIDDATRGVREVGEQVPGYKKILSEFAEDAEFLDELQRSLSTGDKATIEQTYKKLSSSLRTNNERRMNLLQELDDVTGGSLLSEIPGQQLSEELPRGLFRQLAASMGGVGLLTGAMSPGAVLPLILFSSPRVTGEVVGALGLAANKTDALKKAINIARKTLSETYGIPADELYKLFLLGVSKGSEQE